MYYITRNEKKEQRFQPMAICGSGVVFSLRNPFVDSNVRRTVVLVMLHRLSRVETPSLHNLTDYVYQ